MGHGLHCHDCDVVVGEQLSREVALGASTPQAVAMWNRVWPRASMGSQTVTGMALGQVPPTVDQTSAFRRSSTVVYRCTERLPARYRMPCCSTRRFPCHSSTIARQARVSLWVVNAVKADTSSGFSPIWSRAAR